MAGYPVELSGPDGTTRLKGELVFTDPAQQPGAHWFAGGGPPSDLFGLDGDFYLDADNGDVYEKEGGAWV